jgi:hypothetical protein
MFHDERSKVIFRRHRALTTHHSFYEWQVRSILESWETPFSNDPIEFKLRWRDPVWERNAGKDEGMKSGRCLDEIECSEHCDLLQ